MPVNSPNNILDPVLRIALTVKSESGTTTLPDNLPIQSIEITHEVNKLSGAEITLVYEETESGGFDLANNKDLSPGNNIEIKIAYGDEEVAAFTGIILKQRLQMKSAASFQAVITCKHAAIKLTTIVEAGEYNKKTDSDIIKQLVQKGNAGLSAEVDSTSVTMEYLPKPEGTSYWDFILARAEFNGYIVTLDGNKMIVGKPKISSTPILRVALGESIITFNAEINAENQPSAVIANAWDVKKQEEIKATSKEPQLTGPLKKVIAQYKAQQKEPYVINSSSPMAQDELQSLADGKLLRMRLVAFKGQVSYIGNAAVKPGDNIELAGIGKNYDGNVIVSAVIHAISDGQWTTTAKFGIDDNSITQQPDFAPRTADSQVPSVQGLQVATVKKIYDSNETEFRVQLNLPSQSPEQEGVWARLANLHATQGAGTVFFPEVDDEVVVGFLQGNPRFPVVLGSLYSDTRKCSDPAKDDNNYTKAIVTKSKLKISFDDEKKVLTIATPGGNTITLDEDNKMIEIKDQNSNSIKMSSGGIDVKSNKDINLEATGNISLKATGKLTLSANQDVDVSGTNIGNTAKVGFTAKGNATAEISASGQTTVKGGVVMIN